jgi:transcriptional regulator with XRE-family HTH domain
MGSRKANPVDAEVGRRIKLQRLSAGLSQSDLGDKVGVTFQQIQKYEQGHTRVGASRLTEIAAVLKVPVGSFFDGGDKVSKKQGSTQSALDLLSQPLALKLLQIFSEIPDPNLRQSIVQLAENIRLQSQGGSPAATGRKRLKSKPNRHF